MKDETVEAVRERERERETQFSKINIEENRGNVSSICDREKDRKQTDCINQEDWIVFEAMQLQYSLFAVFFACLWGGEWKV